MGCHHLPWCWHVGEESRLGEVPREHRQPMLAHQWSTDEEHTANGEQWILLGGDGGGDN